LIIAIQDELGGVEILSTGDISNHQDKDNFCSSMKSFLLKGTKLPEYFKHFLKDLDNFYVD
jgi:hypothetical protein